MSTGTPRATVEIVLPVHNEAAALERRVRTLRSYLDRRFPFDATVTIADNASTDGTWDAASRVAAQLPGVRAVHVGEKGRGRAVRAVWSTSTAEIVAYMDVDLSTDLDAILPLVAPLISGHSDIAIGSRLARGAHVVRGPKREVISRIYNLVVRATMGNRFTDAQCGFKAARAEVARQLLPQVEDDGWFFDTELLVLAENRGLRIHEVPVDWVDDPDSRVDLVATSIADLRGLWRISRRAVVGRVGRAGPPGRNSLEETTARFLAIGGVSTVAYLALLLILQTAVGILGANAIALTLCAVGNAAAHRGMLSASTDAEPATPRTFRQWITHLGDGHHVGRAALAAWVAGLALSTLALLGAGALSSSVVVALVAVLVANAVVSLGRLIALRSVMYHHHLDSLDRTQSLDRTDAHDRTDESRPTIFPLPH
jgi:hypothetical protein